MQSDLNLIQTMFDRMNGGGFDTKSKLKWGFSFYNDDEKRLKEVYEDLKKQNYVFEFLDKEDNEDKEYQWHLYVTKVDILSVDQLHKRNISFEELANRYDVLYDGWDVERI
jgi:hypothetical protein